MRKETATAAVDAAVHYLELIEKEAEPWGVEDFQILDAMELIVSVGGVDGEIPTSEAPALEDPPARPEYPKRV